VVLLDVGRPGEDTCTPDPAYPPLPPIEGGENAARPSTAHPREEERRHAIASGFQAHPPKPLEFCRHEQGHGASLYSSCRYLAPASLSRDETSEELTFAAA
jgi:hypothetical protein